MTASKSFVDINETLGETGVATTEYAIGAVTAAGVAGVTWWLVNQGWSRNGIEALLNKVSSVPGM